MGNVQYWKGYLVRQTKLCQDLILRDVSLIEQHMAVLFQKEKKNDADFEATDRPRYIFKKVYLYLCSFKIQKLNKYRHYLYKLSLR